MHLYVGKKSLINQLSVLFNEGGTTNEVFLCGDVEKDVLKAILEPLAIKGNNINIRILITNINDLKIVKSVKRQFTNNLNIQVRVNSKFTGHFYLIDNHIFLISGSLKEKDGDSIENCIFVNKVMDEVESKTLYKNTETFWTNGYKVQF